MAQQENTKPDATSEDATAILLKEYCPPLDSAIVLAILLDYEADSISEARAVLDLLKAETIVDFVDGASSEKANSDWGNNNAFSDDGENTTNTTHTSKSEESGDSGESDEVQQLVLMFPTLSKYTLKYTLEKCGGDVDRAIDELLNKSFLDKEGDAGGKSIDGFSEDAMIPSRRKGKRKGKNAAHVTDLWDEVDSASEGGGKSQWETMESEITYISSKLNVPKASASSAYHKYGGLSASLLPLIKAHGHGDIVPDDAAHLETISTICAKYPRLDKTHVTGLVKLCKDDIATSHKFADILNRRHSNKLAVDTPPMTPNLTRNNEWHTVSSPKSASFSQTALSPISPARNMTYRTAATRTNEHALARSEAFNKAYAAHRKAKGDHLMGAVATYYAEQGKDHSVRMKAYDNMAAEALVASNSSEYMLDLHGVSVAQAVKIANEGVTDWWVKTNSTDTKAVTPFHIITGIGSHSKNGESRLGPAVSKMLVRENWKIEVNHGHITVLGVRKAVKKK